MCVYVNLYHGSRAICVVNLPMIFLCPSSLCGCGAGDAGCEDCGCCKVCGGELDPHEMINHDNSIDDDIEYIYEDGREDVKARMEANEIELKKKVKRKKKKPKKEEDKKKGLDVNENLVKNFF